MPKAGDLVEFTVFDAAGCEWMASGHVWGFGPRVRGGWTLWVHHVFVAGPEVPDSPLAVAVVKPNTRHRVGIVRRGRYYRAQGRYVDKDHYYTETHSASPSGALTRAGVHPPKPPTSIRVKPLDPVTMALLSGEAEPV